MVLPAMRSIVRRRAFGRSSPSGKKSYPAAAFFGATLTASLP
jgi:hypothetical protein